ncbi:MAG: hypothetical protein K5650_08195, partial [Bacteroidales bacterium]|nr:hypothetical protein [Bacteroidales bacterium]
MKLRLLRFIIAIAAVMVGGEATAQNEAEIEAMMSRYTDAYDSLLNSYYVRRYAQTHSHRNHTVNVQEFDQIPDSVIISRLNSLHTVIPMTYNEEV